MAIDRETFEPEDDAVLDARLVDERVAALERELEYAENTDRPDRAKAIKQELGRARGEARRGGQATRSGQETATRPVASKPRKRAK